MQRSLKYGGLGIAGPLAGYVWANVMDKPPLLALWAAGLAAGALALWSLYWAYRDLMDYFRGRKEGETTSPPFIWAWRLKFQRDSRFPVFWLLPLHLAAVKAVPRIRRLQFGAGISLGTLEAMSNNDPKKTVEIVAGMLLNEGNGAYLPVYGILAPSEEFEQIPENDVIQFRLSDDTKSLKDPYSAKKYTCLAIKRADLKRRLKDMGA